MPKMTEAYCQECDKIYTKEDIIEVNKTYNCPNCDMPYIDKYKSKSITCNNKKCYTHNKSLLIDIEFYKHQKEIEKVNAEIDKAEPKDIKSLTKKIVKLNNEFRKEMRKRRSKEFDYNSLKYKCVNCDNIMKKSEWKSKNMVCPKCDGKQTETIKSDKIKFTPKPSKHIVACCPEFHILGRYPNHDY